MVGELRGSFERELVVHGLITPRSGCAEVLRGPKGLLGSCLRGARTEAKMGRKSLSQALGLAVGGSVLVASSASATVNIETVPIGNAGNAADTTGYGRVDYAYNIGKYEVTAGQYTAFLNAVAKTDTYAVYDERMGSSPGGCKIQQTGSSGSFSYAVASDYANHPVNYVGFWDATRFANWLSNGQPTGAEGAGTTETGAYTLTDYGIASNTITRNTSTATWAVTSEDEWYKAAYYTGSG